MEDTKPLSRVDEYLESVRHSLIHNEDFGPSDWYFSPDIAPHCWGIFLRSAGSADLCIGLVPLDKDTEFQDVLDRLGTEFMRRFSESSSPTRLALVVVADGESDALLGGFVRHVTHGSATLDVLAVDVATRRLLSPAGFRTNQPGARSIGFPETKDGNLSVPVPEPKQDGRKEQIRAQKWFRQRARRSLAERGTMMGYGEPRITQALIVANVAVAVLGFVLGGNRLTLMMAKFTPLIRAGQWWRVLSYQFVHAGIVHLGFNMYALFNIGPLVEDAFGHAGFGAIYLLSGATGGLASAAFSPRSLSVGASGAIFGLLGATAVFLLSGRISRDILWRAVGYPVVATTIYGFLINLDHMAHFGGLLGGFLIAAAIGLGYRVKKQHRMLAITAFAAVNIVLISMILR